MRVEQRKLFFKKRCHTMLDMLLNLSFWLLFLMLVAIFLLIADNIAGALTTVVLMFFIAFFNISNYIEEQSIKENLESLISQDYRVVHTFNTGESSNPESTSMPMELCQDDTTIFVDKKYERINTEKATHVLCKIKK
jgi:hypothetical protein